jgi:CrcB protein
MTNLLYIAGFGALGSVLRYIMSNGVQTMFGKGFPYGTLSVNIVGSILIGLLYVLLDERLGAGPVWKAALITGMLGGFTTFSAFSLETIQLMQGGQPGRAALNVLLSVCLCIAGCWLGIIAGRKI